MNIKSSDISVVVQGHVKGRPSDPYADQWTLQSLHSVRRHLPDAQLILSTFKECDVSGLPYDTLVLSEDPGALDLGSLNRMVTHTNRQIVSTSAGLAAAQRPYALKMRYDLVLHGTSFIDYYERYNERNPKWCIFRQRIISCTSISLDPRKVCTVPFAPSDWFHFGYREDVVNLWTIPLIPGRIDSSNPSEIGCPSHRYTAEQHIWVSFLRKYGCVDLTHSNHSTEENIGHSELTIVNNLLLLEPEQLPIICLKYADSDHNTYSKVFNYSHSQWLEMYQRYCLNKYHPDQPVSWVPLLPDGGSATTCVDSHWHKLLCFVANEGARIHLPALPCLNTGGRSAWPGSNERCLAALAKALQPNLVMEISQGDGASALVLKSAISPTSYIFTVRYQPTARDRSYYLEPTHFEDGRLISIPMDVSLPSIRKELAARMVDADLIVFNIDDGRLICDLLHDLKRHRRSQSAQWIVIQQIKSWSVALAWLKFENPKLDLSTFGSSLGIGIVRM